ncbi:hypothetical protein [Dyadobacter aurulentus]|uniref:hypothetical protein n=1 Tax=Dyadobacter sp. UC 10 TaxID=2605428 RepID=UPI0011F39735|nr:hypothetical protein [Dyadobacter sp. UC 10]KAA0992616.1 hypothetical protein FXO21_21800 [Dyadobacter sp. UC 10]
MRFVYYGANVECTLRTTKVTPSMKYLFSTILLVTCVSAVAQTKKGQTIWTAHINSQFVQTLQTPVKSPRYSHGGSGEVSFFIRDELAIGVGAKGSWDGYRLDIGDSESLKMESKTSTSSVNPFMRKYWQLSPFTIYAGVGADLAFSKNKSLQYAVGQAYDDRVNRSVNIAAQAQLGVIYPLTSRLGLEFGARSNLFPLTVNTARLGLLLFTGSETKTRAENSPESPLTKGRWLLSGSFGYTVNAGHTADTNGRFEYRTPATSIELAPALFMRDRLLVGIGIFAGFQGGVLNTPEKAAFVTVGDKKPVLVGLRPFLRKYLSPTKLTPYLEGYASYDRIMGGGGPATNTYNAGGKLGLAYILGKNWIVEANLLGVAGGYSEVGENRNEIATIGGVERFHVKLNAGFKPDFTISYVFR